MKTTILVCALLLVGCGSQIDGGVVVEKSHTPFRLQPSPTLVGKVTVINQIPIPASWSVTIERNDSTRRVNVTQREWESVAVGDVVTIPAR